VVNERTVSINHLQINTTKIYCQLEQKASELGVMTSWAGTSSPQL